MWHSSESNSIASGPATILCNEFKDLTFRSTTVSYRSQWVNIITKHCVWYKHIHTNTGQNYQHVLRISECWKVKVHFRYWFKLPDCIQIAILVPMSLTDRKATLVQIMAWYRLRVWPFPEPMMITFTDTCKHVAIKLSDASESCH